MSPLQLRVLILFALLICPACGRRADPPVAEVLPAVEIAPEPVAINTGSAIPPPRELSLAAEPGDAKGALEVYVTRAANGVWKVQYPNSQRILIGPSDALTDEERQWLGQLVLPVDRPVKLTVTSDSAAAPFAILRFAVAVDAAEGKFAHATVKPTRVGEFAIWSGTGRIGTATVVSAADFDNWLAGAVPLHGAQAVDGSLAQKGQQLFLKLQCINCHAADAKAKGPLLEGLYGSRAALKGGGAEIVDDQYISESIRKPKLKVVEGWEPIMPAYDETDVTAEEMNALVAYIRSLKRGATPDRTDRFPPPVGAPTERPKELAPPPHEK